MNARSRISGGQFLAQLFEKPEDQIEKVRKRYLGRSSTVAAERLRQVREALDGLYGAVLRDDEEGWALVERAVKPLRQVMAPPADSVPVAVPAAPSPPVSPSAERPVSVVDGGATTKPPVAIAKPPVLPLPPPPAAAPPSGTSSVHAAPAPVSRSPWAAGAAPPLVVAPAGPARREGPRPGGVAAAADPGPGTIAVAGVPAIAVTPFRAAGAAGPAPTPISGPAEQPVSTGTSSLSEGHLAQHAGAPVPFGGGAPSLTVQQYAQLCALLAERPDEAGASFAKYGLADDAARAAVDAEWKARLASDETNRQLFELLYERIRKQLHSGR